jgi:hypothetical protein
MSSINLTLKAPAHPCLLQTIHNSQVMETAKMPLTNGLRKNVVSIHNGILCSHEEERNVIIRW